MVGPYDVVLSTIMATLSGVARSKASRLNLPGANVRLSKVEESHTEILSTVEAGEDGVYDFGRRRPGQYSITVNAEDVDQDDVPRVYVEETIAVTLGEQDVNADPRPGPDPDPNPNPIPSF